MDRACVCKRHDKSGRQARTVSFQTRADADAGESSDEATLRGVRMFRCASAQKRGQTEELMSKSWDSADDVCRCEKDCRCECETKALLQRTCGFCTKECFYDKV